MSILKKPVSRQQEIAMKGVFLAGGPIGRTVSLVLFLRFRRAENTRCTPKEDSHLRSVWQLTGYEVWATDSEIGRLEGFICGHASWHLGYLDVKAGDWLHSRSMLVPLAL